MDETQGKVRYLSLALTWAVGVVGVAFFALIAAGAAPAFIFAAVLAFVALLILAHAPGGVWHIETEAMTIIGQPGFPAPRIPKEAAEKSFEPSLPSPPPRPLPAI